MKLIKLTVLFLSFILVNASCERRDLEDYVLENKNILLTGGQEVPATPSTATGKMEAFYNKITKTLSYTLTWSGIQGGTITGMHIHGPSDPGFNAAVLQSFSGYKTTPSGTYNGTLVADGVAVKEEDILGGKMYVNIHNATYPGGEIRGQITFPNQ
jgi:hypothetical protein